MGIFDIFRKNRDEDVLTETSEEVKNEIVTRLRALCEKVDSVEASKIIEE